MKKTDSKRGSGYESGLGSAVLTAPQESCVSETEGRGSRREPAPAGALQRGYGSGGFDGPEDGLDVGPDEDLAEGPYAGRRAAYDEPEHLPKRGKQQASLRLRFRRLPRSAGGRMIVGAMVLLLLSAVAAAAAGTRYYVMHDARFVLTTSDDIQIGGAEHLTRDQMLAVFGADLERNIFRVPMAERQAGLERLPWVAHATVMRLLPHTLRVQITERKPVAFVRQGTQVGLVDASGVLLGMPPDAAGDPDRAARMEVYQQFMRELDSTGQHLSDAVSEVDISDPEDVKALITSDGTDVLVHFGDEQFLQRYQEFERHLAEWKQQYPRLASADMRYAGQIVLEMQGDGDAVALGGQAPTVGLGQPNGPTGDAVLAAPVQSPARPARPVRTAKAAVRHRPAKVGRPAGSRTVAKSRSGSGVDVANERVFAQLAAAQRARLAKEHKAPMAKNARNRKSGGAGGDDGVTP